VAGARSVTGEIALIWRDVHPYEGGVVLLTLDPDDPRDQSTFEVRGPLADRLAEALEEGMRVRVDCRAETVEVVNVENGETSDERRAVVVDVVVLEPTPGARPPGAA
jgi:hypothetical protein